MFQEWGFLLGEIWGLLALAALVGLIAGWLIFGREAVAVSANTGEADGLRRDLAECRSKGQALTSRVAELEAQLASARAAAAAPAAVVTPVAAPVMAAVPQARPVGLDGPRGGKPDDLKLIVGVGPKLEALCNRLGFWHFDQIAAWTPAEVAWVDDNLEGFKGRVTRDNWIAQARDLAKAG
jgi:predicted flap endonuclease-1-like 5' DNA nuclease